VWCGEILDRGLGVFTFLVYAGCLGLEGCGRDCSYREGVQ
jgi:hypothetical protein